MFIYGCPAFNGIVKKKWQTSIFQCHNFNSFGVVTHFPLTVVEVQPPLSTLWLLLLLKELQLLGWSSELVQSEDHRP